jgi:urease accessory protein
MNWQKVRIALSPLASVGIVLGAATPVFAHSVDKRFGDFYGGMLHPLTTLEHLLPILGLALLAGQQEARRGRWILLVFPLGLLVGACTASYMEPSAFVTWFNRLSFILVGILVVATIRLPLPVLAAFGLLLGLTHGYENVAGISSTVAIYLFVPGVVVSGIALAAVVSAIVVSLQAPWQQIAVRVIGSWITAIGLLVIAVA